MLTLPDLCALVAGRATLVIELKSRFDGDRRLAERAATVLTTYPGPAALMSFDPTLIEALRKRAPDLPRGIVAERHYAQDEWGPLPRRDKRSMAHLLHIPYTRPHFIAYAISDLPTVATTIARDILRMPLLTWTVRSENDRRQAQRYADQIIFEDWRP
jgi:glycerophosphoryl diester phosphodiesterase